MSPPVQNRTICFEPSAMMAIAWRFASAVARLRAGPITALAPLSHMLISGFFLSQGFLICSQLKGNSMTVVTRRNPKAVALATAIARSRMGLVGREGIEPSTNGLRVRCSTS